MNKLLTITAAVLVTAAVGAQHHTGWAGKTTTKVTTATKNGFAVQATTSRDSGLTRSASIADATDVTRGRWIRASATNGYASARTGATYHYKIGSGGYLSDYGSAGSNSGTNKGSACTANGTATKATCSAHSVLVNFAVKDGEEVTLVLQYSGSATDKLASGSGAIDVGNNGSAELAVTNTAKHTFTSKEVKVKAGKTGIDVLLTTTGMAANSGKASARYSCYASVYVKIVPKTVKCTITPFDESKDPDNDPKTGCGGNIAGSTGTSYSSRWLRVNLTGAAKNAVGFSVVGGKTLEVGLPGSKCKLLVDPTGLFLIPFTTSSTGTKSHFVNVSAALKGTVYVQDVLLVLDSKGATITSTNGLKIECKEE